MPKVAPHKKNELRYEIFGIGFLALAVLSFVSLFTNSTGPVGGMLDKVIRTIAGEGRFVLPLAVAAWGIKLIKDRKKASMGSQTAGGAAAFVLILTVLHLQLDLDLKQIFKAGVDGQGGGIIGGIVSSILLAAFGRTGTYIVLVFLIIVSTVLVTNISFLVIFRFISRSLTRMFNSVKGWVAGFIYTEVDEDEQTVREPAPEPSRVLMDGKVFEINRNPAKKDEVTIKAEEDEEFPKINIYPEPIERVITREDHRGRSEIINFDERKAKVKKPEGFPPLPELGAHFSVPPLSLLTRNTKTKSSRMNKDITENVRMLEEILDSFGVKAKVTEVSRGPAITRYEVLPAPGVKVSRIVNLADDIALGLAAQGVRIAPVPGKTAVGIEVPNKEISMVTMRELLETEEFRNSHSRLTFVLGQDIGGSTIIADLAHMPHLLIAGATGSGKSVCMNTLIASILFKSRPDEVKLLMIDPKMVELTTYNGIPHLISPVVTDAKRASASLRWAVKEMEKRYELFSRAQVKDINRFNQALETGAFTHEAGRLPFVVIVIDELADLMMEAPADVEDAICRLAQMARAAGMHLVVATQRPSTDVITGLIKANIPSRISFAVSSQIDSRTIIDMAGAEKLLGRGDMLFLPVGAMKPIRVQGAFLSDKEVETLVAYLKVQGQPEFIEGIGHVEAKGSIEPREVDELFQDAVRVVLESEQASISMIQRRLRVGYARAARLIDMMEERRIVGKYEGSKPRTILMSMEQFQRSIEDNDSDKTRGQRD